MNALILTLLVLVLGYVSYVFSKIASVAKNYRKQKTAMDQSLDRRYQIFTKLIESLKNGMDIEKSNLGEIPLLREKSLAAQKEDDEKTRIGMEDKISHIAGGVSFIFEQHRELKENKKAHEIHEELIKIEEKLAHYKGTLNNLIDDHLKVNSGLLPWVLNKIFSKQLHVSCEPWHINSEALDEREKYSVQM